jgi:hypothetical protein
MSLLTGQDLLTLDVGYQGQSFVSIEAKNTNSGSLDLAFEGQPFWVTPSTQPTIYLNIGGTWKQADAVYVNVGGTWKMATAIASNVSGTWKF